MQPINRFALVGDSVHAPLDLASARPGESTLAFSLAKPSTWNTEADRNSYCWIYARCHQTGPIQDHVLMIMQEFVFQGRMIRVIWLDTTGNFDFRNIRGDTLWNLYSEWRLHIADALAVDLQPFPVSQFAAFAQMHDASVRSLSGPRVYLGSQSAFRYKRNNVRWGLWNLDSSQQLCVALIDQNFNGQYADPGVDKVLVSLDSSYFNDEDAVLWDKRSEQVDLVWRGRPFTIRLKDGQLIVEVSDKADHPLVAGKRLPRIPYEYAAAGFFSELNPGTHRSWRGFRKQKLCVYVWQSDMGLDRGDSMVLAAFFGQQFKQWQTLLSEYKREHEGEEPSKRVMRSWVREPNSVLNCRVLMMAQGGSFRYVQTLNRRFGFYADQLVLGNRAARKMQWQSLPQVLEINACGRIVDADANLALLLGL